MSTRLTEHFGAVSGSSSSGAKSLATFLSANGLDARLITGEKIGDQFKNFANMGERSESTGLNSFHDSLASVNKNTSKTESNIAGLLKGFISSGLNVLSQSFEAGLNQVNFPVFLLDGAPASISIDLSGEFDLSQFMNLQSYSEARKLGADYIDSLTSFSNDASDSDDLGDGDTESEFEQDQTKGNDEQTKRWRSSRSIQDFLTGSVNNFKVLVSIDSEKSLLVDCAVNTSSRLIFANVWVAGDNYFFELVSNNIDSLASKFNSQHLSLFGYNIFNKEPPIYEQQPGLGKSGNINLEA